MNDDGRHAHGHQHGPSLARAGARHVRRLAIAFGLIAAYFVVEVVAGFVTNSLALLSDAGHMLADVVGLGMALAAIQLATRYERTDRGGRGGAAPSRHTFGLYRLEILAAFVNALLLFAVADLGGGGSDAAVVRRTRGARNPDACRRRRGPRREPDRVRHPPRRGEGVAQRARRLPRGDGRHARVGRCGDRGDLVELFGWGWIDPVIGAALGLWILPRTYRLGAQAVRILLQSAPAHLDLAGLHHDLGAIPGVVGVHDLHVWTLTSEMEAASVHLVIVEGIDQHAVLDQARSMLSEQYQIDHGTFQIEPASHTGCTEVEW